MAEIDPVILELRADVDQYLRKVRSATRTVNKQLGRQEAQIKKLEDQFRRSSSAIGGAMKGLAATLATAFTGRELVGLLDSFTRFQNQLKVAGLEGEQLANVQERLRTIGREYGADLESLGSTFSRIAQVQGDLGASTEQIIQLNEIVAASLKVAGTDAQAASGALLQLGQAFGSGVVRAEEFNSILEGALPLAQAAARGIDGYGGSVAKLRADIAAGNVTSKEFFEGVLRGGVQTLADAQNATLTFSGAITGLRNELTVYFGEAGQAAGATEALALAIQALADNLDTIIPLLAIVAVGLGVGYVTNAVRARIATIALGTAATATGRALLAALGGPVGIAITAVAVGLALVANEAGKARQATQEFQDVANTASTVSDKLREAQERLASAHGKTRQEALEAAKAEREYAKQALIAARASLAAAAARRSSARAELRQAQAASSQGSGGFLGVSGIGRQGAAFSGVDQAQANFDAARNAVIEIRQSLNDFDAGVGATSLPAVSTGRSTGSSSTASPSGSTTITDPAATRRRFDDQMDSIRAQVASAELRLATSIEERAELELRQVEAARRQAIRALETEDEFDAVQKQRIAHGIESVADAERDAINFQKRADLEQRALDIQEDRGRAQLDALRIEFDLADTEADRRNVALRILEAEQELLRSRLEGIVASDTALEADKERARIALDALNAQASGERARVEQQFEGPLARFGRGTRDTDTRVQEAAVRRIEQLNETITDAMTNALGIEDPFLRDLIGIFLDKNVFGPLAEALSDQQGGGILGAVGSLLGGLFGRSSGGFVQGGRPYRVNEGAPPGRVEAFVPQGSGQIIPLGQMNALQSGGAQAGGVVRIVIDEAPGFASTVRTEAAGVALEVTRQSAPAIVEAAANETQRRFSRPTL